MIQTVYVSSSTELFDKATLMALLKHCRENNQLLEVSGLLLYKDGNFMQVLEGDEKTVKELLKIIKKDRRHSGVLTLLETPIEEREFQDWSMAFRDLNDPKLQDMPGFNEFLNTSLEPALMTKDFTNCLKLIKWFKKNM